MYNLKSLKEANMKKSYFKNISSSYLQIGISMIIPLFLTPVIIRFLGPEQYGLWVLLNTIISYFNLSDFGFTTTILREIAGNREDKSKVNTIINTTIFSFFIFTFVALLIFLILYKNIGILFNIPDSLTSIAENTFIIVFIIFIVNFITSVFYTLFYANNRLYIKNLVISLQSLFIGIATYFIVKKDNSIFEVSFSNLLITLVFSVIAISIAFKKYNIELNYKLFKVDLLKSMLLPSLHYFIISIGAILVFQSDTIIISMFIGLTSLASYSIMYKVTDIIRGLIFKVVDILMPNIATLHKEKRYDDILKLHNKTLLYTILLSIPSFLLLCIFGIEAINLWVGSDVKVDQNILIIIAITMFIHTLVHVSAVFVSSLGIHKTTSYITLLEAILNIILSIVFIKYIGLMGVALGSLLANIMTGGWFTPWYFYRYINKKRKIDYFKTRI